MTVILFLLLSFSAFAQGQFAYQLSGTFIANPDDPVTVNYSISWNEAGPSIQGIYKDNYYSKAIPKVVTGRETDDGRNFSVILPAEVAGVSILRFGTSVTSAMSGSIPMTIETYDRVGGLVNNETNFAMMSALPAATNDPVVDENACTIGFGALTGFCGLYEGSIGELADPGNRCNLISGGSARLELGTDTVFRLHLNFLPGIPSTEIHNIGSFIPTPMANTISITGTNCGPMPGTTFQDNCKEMNLSGTFSQLGSSTGFTGMYSIRDQVTGETCTHSMILNRTGM